MNEYQVIPDSLKIEAKPFCCIINPLFTKLVRSRWLDFNLVLFFFFFAFKHPNNSLMLEITGPRRLENGPVMPGKITVFAKSATI